MSHNNGLQTPILLIIFNRPETTLKVFERIRAQQPQYLYIAADGARPDNADDKILCEQCRDVIKLIDWKCQVRSLFKEENVGSKYGVSSAITWLFEHEEMGIILEDDCIPSDSFFTFCELLLFRFKDNDRVMHITGSNLNDEVKFGVGSYYYSNYPNVWGWATWRRAWKLMDLELTDNDFYISLIKNRFQYISERTFWHSRLMLVKAGIVDAWDYQWMFSIWKANGLCLNSNYNLVTNIGFGEKSTHTSGKSPYLTPQTKGIYDVQHPSTINIYDKAESAFIKTLHGVNRKGYFLYYTHKHIIQKFINLLHKIKTKSIVRYFKNEKKH